MTSAIRLVQPRKHIRCLFTKINSTSTTNTLENVFVKTVLEVVEQTNFKEKLKLKQAKTSSSNAVFIIINFSHAF